MGEPSTGVLPGLFQQIRNSNAPGMDPDAVEEILRKYFSGRRDSLRTCKFFDLEVMGRHGNFAGMTVDLSRSGALVRISDPTFASAEEMTALMPYTARVWYHLEGGFSIKLNEVKFQLPADVVRVTGYCGRGSSLILIGCRFRRNLTEDECKVLEISCSDDQPPAK